MKKTNKKTHKNLASDFVSIFSEFGSAMAEVFDDPKLKKEASHFAKSASVSAKIFVNRFKDKKVKVKFRKAGKAAQKFGRQMETHGKKLGKQIEKMNKSAGKKVKKSAKSNKKYK